jgi:sugar diacid utilization regulator
MLRRDGIRVSIRNIVVSTINRTVVHRRQPPVPADEAEPIDVPLRVGTSLAGDDEAAAIATIAGEIGCRAIILDDLRIETAQDHGLDALGPDLAGKVAAAAKNLATRAADDAVHVIHGSTRSCAIAALDLTQGRSALLALVERERGALDLDTRAIDRAVLEITLQLLRRRTKEEARGRVADSLLCRLYFGAERISDGTIASQSASIGIDLTRDNAAIVIAPRDGDRAGEERLHPPAGELVGRALRRDGASRVAVCADGEMVLVLLAECEGQNTTRELAEMIARELQSAGLERRYRIGYADPQPGVAGARKALADAIQAVKVLSVTAGDCRPAALDELGIWTILASADREQLVRYKETILGPLVKHDDRRNSELLATLRALVSSNFESRTTSTTLQVHPNTVRYRMSVITKLTGLDLALHADQIKAHLALGVEDIMSAS